MNKREIVQTLMDSIQKGDFENAGSMLADDFMCSGSVPAPINKDAWLAMSGSLRTAFPDLDYHFRMIGTHGDVVKLTAQLSGTHTEVLDIPIMNMGTIPATNKVFSSKIEKTRVTVKDNKVSAWVVEPANGTGLTEIFDQLGIKS